MPICPLCNGRKYDFKEEGNSGYFVVCRKCHGTGVVDEQTNEEWRKNCSAEEFAEFLFHIAYMCSYCGDEAHSTEEKIQKCHFGKCCCQRQDWVEWLKQPHKE